MYLYNINGITISVILEIMQYIVPCLVPHHTSWHKVRRPGLRSTSVLFTQSYICQWLQCKCHRTSKNVALFIILRYYRMSTEFKFSCSPGTGHVSHSRSFNSSFNTQSGLCCSYTLLINLFGSLSNEAGDPFDIEI